MTSDKPKSWFGFIAGIALGVLVFLPLTAMGIAFERIPLFLTGLAGIGVTFIVAAFMGMHLATGIAQGRYNGLRPLSWRDQVWMLVAALAVPVMLVPQTAEAQGSPLAREELRRCMDRDEFVAGRLAELDAEKRMNDREGESIARAGAMLAEELRRVDPADAVGVAAHNARAAEHNRRVEAHNLRVIDMNDAARRLNRGQADLSDDCGSRSYYRRDRDAILYERAYLR